MPRASPPPARVFAFVGNGDSDCMSGLSSDAARLNEIIVWGNGDQRIRASAGVVAAEQGWRDSRVAGVWWC